MSKEKPCSDERGFALSAAEIRELANSAFISVSLPDDSPTAREEATDFVVSCDDTTEDYQNVQKYLKQDEDEYAFCQRIAVVGPVYVLFDNEGAPLAMRSQRSIVVVSTPEAGLGSGKPSTLTRLPPLCLTTSRMFFFLLKPEIHSEFPDGYLSLPCP